MPNRSPEFASFAPPVPVVEGYIGNPAANPGRFTRTAKTSEVEGIALTPEEVEQLPGTAKRIRLNLYPTFLLAAMAGLRQGEVVALQWGGIEFGNDDDDDNRFILVQHNYVPGEHTTAKSKKSRRVDMSRRLRTTLIEMRDARLKAANEHGETNISKELVFSSPEANTLYPDNFDHRPFVSVLKKSRIQ